MDKLSDLAARMRAKRESGSHPYVLVLGAGASVSSGTSLNRAVVERVVGTYDLKAFDEHLSQCSDDERFAVLRELVEGAAPSQGYRCLAELIRSGYFNVVLSTNFDPLLEDAITELRMRRRDYVFLVHGVMEPDLIADHMDKPVPRVKILKLHGDLFYCKFFYTGQEIAEFPQPIQYTLETCLNHRDVLIVGHGMRDSDINRCLRGGSHALWYVNQNPPTSEIAEFMKQRSSEDNFIAGDEGSFDSFFTRLRDRLLGGTAEIGVDAIKQSIFSISAEGQSPVGSGFLLGDTGLVITDSSIVEALGQGRAAGVKAAVRPFAGGLPRQAELVVAPVQLLDYAAFKIQGMIEASPLQLTEELPAVGEPLTACISVGDTQGFRDGKVTRVNVSVPLRMQDGTQKTFSKLLETDIKIAEGACGSPLIRKDGRVVGAVVAGNGHSYALTALRLREMLARAGLLSRG